jgi:5-methyltetrahydropteroyltriglutamate--homocysteine methyltransferase
MGGCETHATNAREDHQRGVAELETKTAVYHAEVIGSMLRPPWLVEARAAMRAGQMDADSYRAVEDRAVDEALGIQEAAGVDVVTDGEMRRDIFFDAFVAGMDGFSHEPAWTVQFHRPDEEQAFQVEIPFTVTERIRPRRSPALDEFLAAKDRTSRPLKITIPSPTLVVAFWNNERSRLAYNDPFELFADSAEAIREWVGQLFDAGCQYVQIDAPEFNEVYADPRVRAEYVARGVDPDRFKAEGAELLARVADVPRGPDTVLGLHVCKGNGTQSYIAVGGYEDICQEVFRRAQGFDVFLMEYDDERSGSFEPLRHLPDDKVAVLGLVSTKWRELEDPTLLRQRIEDAARFHPKERLALATQCGFASASETAEQRLITTEVQAAKLKLVADVARDVWG